MLIDETKIKSDLEEIALSLDDKLNEIRAGRPSIKIFDRITVEYYGAVTPLAHVGRPVINGNLGITFTVFDKSITKSVEESLRNANLGATINVTESGVININFPPLTSEVREERKREVGEILEAHRVRVRNNVRRKFMDQLDSLEKVSEDEVDRSKEKLEKLISEGIENLNNMGEEKKKEFDSI